MVFMVSGNVYVSNMKGQQRLRSDVLDYVHPFRFPEYLPPSLPGSQETAWSCPCHVPVSLDDLHCTLKCFCSGL